MFMIFFVLDDPALLSAVLQAWDQAGIRGATILESTGINRKLKRHVPMRYVFHNPEVEQQDHFTLLAIVDNQDMITACLQATESITGDLDDPHTGVFAAWPLATVKGLPPREG